MPQKLFYANVDINSADAGTILVGAISIEEGEKILKEAVYAESDLPDSITYIGKLCELKNTPYLEDEDDRILAKLGDITGLFIKKTNIETLLLFELLLKNATVNELLCGDIWINISQAPNYPHGLFCQVEAKELENGDYSDNTYVVFAYPNCLENDVIYTDYNSTALKVEFHEVELKEFAEKSNDILLYEDEDPSFNGNFNITIQGAEIQNLLFLDEKEITKVTASINYWKDDISAPATMGNIKIGVSNLSFLKKSGEQSDAIPYHWCMDIQTQIKDIIVGNIHYLIQKEQPNITLQASELAVPQISGKTYLLKPKNDGYHTTDEGNTVLNTKPNFFNSFISKFLKENKSDSSQGTSL